MRSNRARKNHRTTAFLVASLFAATPPLAIACFPGTASPLTANQPDDSVLVPTLIRSGPLLELSNEADREFRLLIVYGLKDKQKDWFAEHLATSETLAEFVRDHCMVVRII